MFIDIIPLQKNTARLTRVYGDAPCAALPASVPGPEGGVLAITELGDYCFSEKPRSLPGANALCRYVKKTKNKKKLKKISKFSILI